MHTCKHRFAKLFLCKCGLVWQWCNHYDFLFWLLLPQSTHKVATATFWRTFHHDGKIAQPGEGWGGITPFIISTITYKVLVYAPAERADTLPLFLLYPYMYSVIVTIIGFHSGGGGGGVIANAGVRILPIKIFFTQHFAKLLWLPIKLHFFFFIFF